MMKLENKEKQTENVIKMHKVVPVFIFCKMPVASMYILV